MCHLVFNIAATRNPPAKPVDFNVGDEDEILASLDDPWHDFINAVPTGGQWQFRMEELYRAKGGTAEEFYGVNLQLDAADLDALDHEFRSHPYLLAPFLFLYMPILLDTARDRLSRGEAVYCCSCCSRSREPVRPLVIIHQKKQVDMLCEKCREPDPVPCTCAWAVDQEVTSFLKALRIPARARAQGPGW
jgi:hypothetical protein